MGVSRKKKQLREAVVALRAEYPSLCPSIIAAQLGVNFITVHAILERQAKQRIPRASVPTITDNYQEPEYDRDRREPGDAP